MCSNVLVTLVAQLSGHNPLAAICARGDLDAAHPVPKVRMRHVCVTCCSKRMRPALCLPRDPCACHTEASACSASAENFRLLSPQGCLDTKVTSAALALRLEADVIAGPTNQVLHFTCLSFAAIKLKHGGPKAECGDAGWPFFLPLDLCI